MNAAGDPELRAKEYLEKHRIMELLSQLTSFLLFDRPKKPREYLISLLERLRIAKITGVAFPFLMENSNIVSMFEMMDASGRGCISFVQYKEALKNLGLCTADEVLHDDGHIITLDKFRDEVKQGKDSTSVIEMISKACLKPKAIHVTAAINSAARRSPLSCFLMDVQSRFSTSICQKHLNKEARLRPQLKQMVL